MTDTPESFSANIVRSDDMLLIPLPKTSDYTEGQRIDVFISPFKAKSEPTKKGKNKYTKICYPIMRGMEKGEEYHFPTWLWSRARSAASSLKKQYGVRFYVSKVNNEIVVKRLE